MNLSKRLQTIYDMVPQGVVADIGADHGKLIISLVENGIASHGYAIENKEGPYKRLCEAIKHSRVSENVTPLFSDGIKDLPTDVNTIIIAGMGGLNVISILKRNLNKLKNVDTIIVDAHNAIPKMREEICSIGYIISDEQIVKEEGIYYEIIKFIKSDIAFYSEADIEFGPILRQQKSSLFKQKYEERIDEIDRLISTNDLPYIRIVELKTEKNRIRSVL